MLSRLYASLCHAFLDFDESETGDIAMNVSHFVVCYTV